MTGLSLAVYHLLRAQVGSLFHVSSTYRPGAKHLAQVEPSTAQQHLILDVWILRTVSTLQRATSDALFKFENHFASTWQVCTSR